MTHEEDLRAWAKGIYTREAGTELLIRGSGGKFAREGQPWIRDSEGGTPWIDFETIPEEIGPLSDGQQSFLNIAASLAADDVPVVLGEVLPGLDRAVMELVLAAAAHANGSHGHSGIREREDGTSSVQRLSALYPWPQDSSH